jgi:hypothetical protein
VVVVVVELEDVDSHHSKHVDEEECSEEGWCRKQDWEISVCRRKLSSRSLGSVEL